MSRAPSVTRRRFLQIAALHSAAFAAGLRAASAGPEARPHTWQGIALGAEATIQLYGENAEQARAVLRECRAEILRLENIFSLYDGHSALARLNRDGRLTGAPAELRELITFCRRCSELTEGAFDISIQPLCELLARDGASVDDEAIHRALALVDYRRIACDGADVRLGLPGMRLTLNGIAQGWITDRIAERLQQRGFTRVLVDVGEKRALGRHPDGRAWRIGLESPSARNQILDIVELDDRALATSGGYGERYGAPGQRHHLLDARAGTSRHDFASVSVLAPTATVADALSTCLAVLPPDAAPGLLAHFPRTEARIVDAAGRVRALGPAA